LRSPLIDAEITGATGILLSIAGGDDLSLLEVNEAAEAIRAAAMDDTNIIFGATIDDRLNGQVWVTVVATGFGGRGRRSTRREGGTTTWPSVPSIERKSSGDDELEVPDFMRE
jgi:cell division protein FtsZ